MNTKSSKIHHKSYDVSTSQFSEVKVRKLTRLCGFSGYSIYRYLVNETFCKGAFLLLWNKKRHRMSQPTGTPPRMRLQK